MGTEALRRICVWKYYGQDDGVGVVYWDYIFEFLKRCDSDDFFANQDCINDVYKNSKVDVCEKCVGCVDVGQCVKSGGKCSKTASGASAGGGVSKKTFGLTLLAMCGIFGAVGYLHWRKTREEMRDQVRGILAEYMPLDGGEIAEDDISVMDFAK